MYVLQINRTVRLIAKAKHDGPGFKNGIKLDPASDALSGPIAPPCSNCTVLKAVANLAYKDGKQADVGNGVYTHHIIIMQVRWKPVLSSSY
jgi:hypothetical protein